MTIRKRTLYWILAAIFAFTAIYAPFSDDKDSSILVTILTILLFIALAILFAHLARKVDPEKAIRFGKAKTVARAASVNGLPRDYTCIDIETTGLPDQDPRIIELGAVRIRNGKVSGTYSQLVNPGKPIPAKVAELTGIYDSLVADSPTIAQALPSFVEFCGTDTLVGHNIDRFDAPIIKPRPNATTSNSPISTRSTRCRSPKPSAPNSTAIASSTSSGRSTSATPKITAQRKTHCRPRRSTKNSAGEPHNHKQQNTPALITSDRGVFVFLFDFRWLLPFGVFGTGFDSAA